MTLKNKTYTLLDWIFQLVFLCPIWAWALAGLALVFFQLLGWRLSRFSRPTSPRGSLMIRHAVRPLLLWPASISSLVVFLGWFALFGLGNQYGVLSQIWQAVRLHFLGFGLGAVLGLLLGGLFYYWLIPGWETPTSSFADPNTAMAQRRNYDPERFFRV